MKLHAWSLVLLLRMANVASQDMLLTQATLLIAAAHNKQF
jgi:hypothetical protein